MPAMYYEPDKKDWLIRWSSTVPAAGAPGGPLDNRIYGCFIYKYFIFLALWWPGQESNLRPSR